MFQMATSRSAGQAAASSASSFWLVKESKGCRARGGGLFCGAKRGDVVVAVNRKRAHNRSPWCHALRGHHMDRSEVIEKQGNSAENRRWRRAGDEAAQIVADGRRW
jgi:hypothetical protein